jgi:hypothetical protein
MGRSLSVCGIFHCYNSDLDYNVATVLGTITTMTSGRIVAPVTSDRVAATMTLDTIVAFVIPLVALLTSSPVMWRKEHVWYVSVLQRVGYKFPILLYLTTVTER